MTISLATRLILGLTAPVHYTVVCHECAVRLRLAVASALLGYLSLIAFAVLVLAGSDAVVELIDKLFDFSGNES